MLLFLIAIIVAFIGYVLPLGNISYWAATVITSLFTVLPLVGKQLVLWLWGSYFISDSMLKLFFTLHFVIPLAILVVILLHLLELHKRGRTSKLGGHHQNRRVSFSIFIVKDFTDLIAVSLLFIWSLVVPLFLRDPESYTLARIVSRPVHISPE